MWRLVSQIPMLCRRAIALLTLFVFVAGSVGVPIGARALAKSGCCCARKGESCACGCCKRAMVQTCSTKVGCCAKKKPPVRNPIVVSCPCGNQAESGFYVAAQPRLVPASTRVPGLVAVSRLAVVSILRPLEVLLAPETPPPRMSAC